MLDAPLQSWAIRRAMCGVGGIFRFDGGTPDLAQLRALNLAQAHRGPDGEGTVILGPIGLGHRRLAISDPSTAGQQPMTTQDRRLWLTFNGELYNHLELKKELMSLGLSFFSESDAEVVLQAYRAFGLGAFERFNGAWALGLWDVGKQELILSRDRFGMRPLVIHENGERLIFASEAKAILAAEPELSRLDLQTVTDFLTQPIAGTGTATYFEGIERCAPATVMCVDRTGRRRSHPYWSFTPPRVALAVPHEEARAHVRELLVDAVRLRLHADGPVGMHLGVDLERASIAAVAAKELGQPLAAFTSVGDLSSAEEREILARMGESYGFELEQARVDPADLLPVLERCTYFHEEPTNWPGLYSEWHLMRTASAKVKVLLDVQGSKALFAGDGPFFDSYARGLVHRAKQLDVDAILEAAEAGPAIKALTGRDPVRARLMQVARARAASLKRRGKGALGKVPLLGELAHEVSRRRPPKLGEPIAPLLGLLVPTSARRSPVMAPTGDPLTDQLWDQLIRASVPGELTYQDKTAMAFSVESRAPFLDHRLVEYVFQLPIREKIRGARTQVILREAMQGLVPEALLERPDRLNASTPFGDWLLERRHREWSYDLLAEKRTKERGLIDTKAALLLWAQHLDGAADHSKVLWRLMTLELFARRFTDRVFRAESIPPRPSLGLA